jgi:hypothetical protein
LQVRFESCAQAKEDQRESINPTLLRSAHDGSFEGPIHLLHKAVHCRVESRCVGKMDSAHAGQGVEEVQLELLALVGDDGLRAPETSYASRQQGAGHRLCFDVCQGNGFRPACEVIYCRQAVPEVI